LNTQHQAFNEASVGQTLSVLLDRKGKQEGQLLGKTPWLQSVHIDAPVRLFGECVDVKIEKASANSLTGMVVTVG